MGHICRDVVPEPPGWRPGGSVLYAARTAAQLGRSVGVVTAGADEADALRALPGTTVINLTAKRSTSFENQYERGQRRQHLRALAPPISASLIPPEWTKAPVVLLAPVAGEVPPSMVRLFSRSMLGVCPQGWMRTLAVNELVRGRPWDRALEVLPNVAAAIFSSEDIAGQPAAWLSCRGPLLVETLGPRGCEVLHDGKRRAVAGFPADEINPTGAGDVFAATFMLKLHELREPLEAARLANMVAAAHVAGARSPLALGEG